MAVKTDREIVRYIQNKYVLFSATYSYTQYTHTNTLKPVSTFN